jgi:hypothetical protein
MLRYVFCFVEVHSCDSFLFEILSKAKGTAFQDHKIRLLEDGTKYSFLNENDMSSI